MTDEAGEADRTEVAQGDAEAAAEDPEYGVLGGHPQVAPEGELDAAGHGVALDGGDDGLGEGEAGRAHGAAAFVGDGAAVALGHGLEVGAGAEGAAGAGEHGHGGLGVGVEGEEGLAELVGADAVDCIAALGAVDRDHGDRAVMLDPKMSVCAGA